MIIALSIALCLLGATCIGSSRRYGKVAAVSGATLCVLGGMLFGANAL